MPTDKRLKDLTEFATEVYGPRWQSKLSRSSGLSQSYLSMISSGERPLTDDVVKKVMDGVIADAKAIEQRATSMRSAVKAWKDRLARS